MNQHLGSIGRYEKVRRLGGGGMGEVYLARDPNINRHVAVKIVRNDDEEFRQRFKKEVELVGALRHRHIVTIFDSGEDNGLPYLAMEYIPGETLAQKIKARKAIPVPEKLRYIEELCEGLAHAHRKGVVHRDIKPPNVIVDDESDSVKILDFGIARVADSTMTRVGSRIGTLSYMSPEQLAGKPGDARSDIFATGAVLYELLSLRRAFGGDTEAEIEYRIREGEAEPLATCAPGLDAGVIAIVERALAKNPADRFPDAAGMAYAIKAVRRRISVDTGAPTIKKPRHDDVQPAPAADAHPVAPKESPAPQADATLHMESRDPVFAPPTLATPVNPVVAAPPTMATAKEVVPPSFDVPIALAGGDAEPPRQFPPPATEVPLPASIRPPAEAESPALEPPILASVPPAVEGHSAATETASLTATRFRVSRRLWVAATALAGVVIIGWGTWRFVVAAPAGSARNPTSSSAVPAGSVSDPALSPAATSGAAPTETELRIVAPEETEMTLDGQRVAPVSRVSPGDHHVVFRLPRVIGSKRHSFRVVAGEPHTLTLDTSTGLLMPGVLPFPYTSVRVDDQPITAPTRALTGNLRAVYIPDKDSAASNREIAFDLLSEMAIDLGFKMPQGRFRFEVTPAAQVTFDARFFSARPTGSLAPVADGTYPIKVGRSGYTEFTGTVVVRADEESLVRYAYNFAAGRWEPRDQE